MTDQGTRVRLVIEVDVHDEPLLREYVERRVKEVWGESHVDEPEIWDGSIEYAVMEAILTSSEGPMPSDMGFEVSYYHAEVL